MSYPIKVADECWVALAELHRANPDAQSFSTREILEKIRSNEIFGGIRPGITAHLHQHNVANMKPSTARYRMFFREPDRTLRLFRSTDIAHPDRKGKIHPGPVDLPPDRQDLIDWYLRQYRGAEPAKTDEKDDILRLRGLGKNLWADTDADKWVTALRAGWFYPSEEETAAPSMQSQTADIWARLGRFQGQEFQTAKGLPYTYKLDGDSGIWFYRSGKRVERRLWRGELEEALRKPAVRGPSDLASFQCPSYLYGLLSDGRITGERR